MNEEEPLSSRGPLTLKFAGVDDEIASDEDIQEEKTNHIQTHTPDSVLFTCNGDSHNLTVNRCYGKNTDLFFLLY
jgi:hypothetical protein